MKHCSITKLMTRRRIAPAASRSIRKPHLHATAFLALRAMTYCFISSPKPLDRGAASLRGQHGPWMPRLAPSGLVGARIRQLTSIANGHLSGPFPPEPDREDAKLG